MPVKITGDDFVLAWLNHLGAQPSNVRVEGQIAELEYQKFRVSFLQTGHRQIRER